MAYRIGKSAAAGQTADLKSEVEELTQEQRDAEITRRVSEQMSEIAQEEKQNSDRQRDIAEDQRREAEKQSQEAQSQRKVAEQKTEEAERQTFLAKQNEGKAKAAEALAKANEGKAKAAENQANRQAKEAHRQMMKRVGSSLGTAALNQCGNDMNLSRQLAYWSWYYLTETGGNKYFSDTYNALVKGSGSMQSVRPVHSSITAITPVQGQSGVYAAVTMYGEILLINGSRKLDTAVLMKHDATRNLDFRAVVAVDGLVYALSVDGRIIVVTTGGVEKTQKIKAGKAEQIRKDAVYSAMLLAKDGHLIVGAQNHIYIVDRGTLERVNAIRLTGQLQCMYHGRTGVALHMSNGDYATLDDECKLNRHEMPQKKGTTVTAGCYDSRYGLTLLGRSDGTTEMYNRYGRHIVDVPGHTSRISAVTLVDTIAVIASYDHVVLVCNFMKFKMEMGHDFRKEMNSPKDFTTRGPDNEEWMTPASFRLDGWPLCITKNSDNTRVLMGTSNGKLESIGVSVDQMAERSKGLVKKDMGKTQWERFMGKGIPYRSYFSQ